MTSETLVMIPIRMTWARGGGVNFVWQALSCKMVWRVKLDLRGICGVVFSWSVVWIRELFAVNIEPDAAVLDDYRSLLGELGYLSLPRTLIELTGSDRASFLNNFCTNDVASLCPGQGCEAFITNVQGKILGHMLVFCGEDRLVADSVAGQVETILPHLDRYLIREDVQLEDRSGEYVVYLLSGRQWPERLEPLLGTIPTSPLQHVTSELAGVKVNVRCVEMTMAPSLMLVCDRSVRSDLEVALNAASARVCGEKAFDMARIEAGWPQYGIDISDTNLPQEIGRDDQAISFTKGCYLGQETVARIDALGHVNWKLLGLQFSGVMIPQPGTELTFEDKIVGRVTSAAYSPCLAAPLALAYVRREHHTAGQQLQSKLGTATVVTLPAGGML